MQLQHCTCHDSLLFFQGDGIIVTIEEDSSFHSPKLSTDTRTFSLGYQNPITHYEIMYDPPTQFPYSQINYTFLLENYSRKSFFSFGVCMCVLFSFPFLNGMVKP